MDQAIKQTITNDSYDNCSTPNISALNCHPIFELHPQDTISVPTSGTHPVSFNTQPNRQRESRCRGGSKFLILPWIHSLLMVWSDHVFWGEETIGLPSTQVGNNRCRFLFDVLSKISSKGASISWQLVQLGRI